MPLSLYYSLVAQFVKCRSECCDKAILVLVQVTLVAAEDERQMLLKCS